MISLKNISIESRLFWKLMQLQSVIFLCGTALYYYHFYTTPGMRDSHYKPLGNDFVTFWTAVQFLKQGDTQGVYSLAQFLNMLNALFNPPLNITWWNTPHVINLPPIILYWWYPPQALFLLWPFTFISTYKMGFAVWSLLGISALAFAMFWRTGLADKWRGLIFFSPGVYISLCMGQNGLLTAALIISGFRLLKDNPWLAGIMFGLLSYKPHFGFLIPIVLLALRQHKAFASAALTTIGLVLASICVFGWQDLESFLHNMASQPVYELLSSRKMITVYATLRVLHWSILMAGLLQALVAAIIALVLYRKLNQMQQAHWTQWLLLTASAIYLATPYGFPYDLCALSSAWLLWMHHQENKRFNTLTILLWLVLWYAPMFQDSRLFDTGLPQIVPLVLIMAFIAAFRQIGSMDYPSSGGLASQYQREVVTPTEFESVLPP